MAHETLGGVKFIALRLLEGSFPHLGNHQAGRGYPGGPRNARAAPSGTPAQAPMPRQQLSVPQQGEFVGLAATMARIRAGSSVQGQRPTAISGKAKATWSPSPSSVSPGTAATTGFPDRCGQQVRDPREMRFGLRWSRCRNCSMMEQDEKMPPMPCGTMHRTSGSRSSTRLLPNYLRHTALVQAFRRSAPEMRTAAISSNR